MTDYSELVKALRHVGICQDCNECEAGRWHNEFDCCLFKDAAAAIEELDAEETRLLLLTSDLQDKLMDLQAEVNRLELDNEDYEHENRRLHGEIEALKAQLPKRGEWIRVRGVDIPGEFHTAAFRCMCSMCRNEYVFPRIPQYCPDCGSWNTAKMEVQE